MNTLAQKLMPHLLLAPILLPLLCAALMLLFGQSHRTFRAIVNSLSCIAGIFVASALLVWSKGNAPTAFGVYLPANWDMPFGIVLVLDRLSALMLLLSSVVALCALLFAIARWQKAGVHFHALFQIQIMGINGLFLTGDLFNLYVFFEIMLAASYGLLLHGSGPSRVRSGMHYVAVNLLASSFFLIGAALIYGITGTLNMADLAMKIPLVAADDVGLLHAGFAVLGTAFLAKAAMWPLNFWLVPAYAAASTPVSALFAVLTKVGFYVLLRLCTLLFPAWAGASAGFGYKMLIYGGMATLVFGSLGIMATQRPARLAAFAVIISAGTLLSIIGFDNPVLTSGALYYLPGSTLAIAAFFLLTELIERSRSPDPEAQLAPEDEEDRLPFPLAELDFVEGINLDEKEQALVGEIIPAALAFLAIAFIICALLVAGMPPMSGFIGKAAMLTALLNPQGMDYSAAYSPTPLVWTWMALIVVSGLLALIALTRAGIRFFWTPQGRAVPQLRVIECVPVVGLIGLCVALSLYAEPALRYTRATASALHAPSLYIEAVLGTQALDYPSRESRQEDTP